MIKYTHLLLCGFFLSTKFDGFCSLFVYIGNEKETTTQKWNQPRPFAAETTENRIAMILKWMCGSNPFENILKGAEKMKNVVFFLEKMKFNGYLRLFQIDMNIVKNCMSDSSWTLYLDFKKRRENDTWKCQQCSSLLLPNVSKWQCAGCLFWIHQECAKPKTNKYRGEEFSICPACLFAL